MVEANVFKIIFQVLFKKELDKAYDPNAPEDDMREREEEMERMREHVFGESDLNKDRLISFEEFLAETKRYEFEKDLGKSMEFLTILLHILKSLIHMINLAQKTPPDLKC